MTEQEIRALVAEVLCLRNTVQYQEEENELISSGAVLNSQVGRADIHERVAELRAMAPGYLLLQTDLETGSYFAPDGTAVPPQMALGAADDEQLACDWGYAVGLEGRRLGVDVTWSPVLDVNTNPDNPIVNVRSFGENVEQVGRLGAAVVRGMIRAGMHPCAKHWPGHGDVAVDSHISLPTVECSRQHLETVEWPPYLVARQAGLESVMTGHLLLPAVDPDNCATVSHKLITGILREQQGYDGVIFTDSLGMEGLRLTIDSAQAAWMAIAAGHDQVLIDYKRPPGESVEAVVAACMDGRVPESRLREAAARVRDLKARRLQAPALPPGDEIRRVLQNMGSRLAEASVTLAGDLPAGGIELGDRPLLVICDDPVRHGKGLADEHEGETLAGVHPLTGPVCDRPGWSAIVCDENTTPEDLARVRERGSSATAILGATFAHITSYKGEGVRLPRTQAAMWRELAASGKLRAMMLFESPYALSDLPGSVPVVIGYGGDPFSLRAVAEAILGKRACPGNLPVTVQRGS